MLSTIILTAAAAYTALGTLFAAWFCVRGVTRLDPAARGTSVLFRAFIAPGTIALWPLLARRCLRSPARGSVP